MKKCFKIGTNKDCISLHSIRYSIAASEAKRPRIEVRSGLSNSTCPPDHFELLNVKIGVIERLGPGGIDNTEFILEDEKYLFKLSSRCSISPILTFRTSK